MTASLPQYYSFYFMFNLRAVRSSRWLFKRAQGVGDVKRGPVQHCCGDKNVAGVH